MIDRRTERAPDTRSDQEILRQPYVVDLLRRMGRTPHEHLADLERWDSEGCPRGEGLGLKVEPEELADLRFEALQREVQGDSD